MSTVPPLRREIIVDTDPVTAFEVFDQARHRGRRQRRGRIPGRNGPPLAPEDAALP